MSPRPRHIVAAAVGAVVVSAGLVGGAAPAQAHAFLVTTSPPQGARLPSAPPAIDLTFTEPVATHGNNVRVRDANGDPVKLGALGRVDGGRRLHASVPPGPPGVFVVTWRALGNDGDVTEGEFAFAVGTGAALPATSTSQARTSVAATFARWLFFGGVAVALGGLAVQRVAWRPLATSASPAPEPLVGSATLTAAAGALLGVLLIAGSGRLIEGLRPGRWSQALGGRPGALAASELALIGAAGGLWAIRRRPSHVGALLVAAVFVEGFRGHAALRGPSWAPVVDAIHFLAAAVWVGALGQLARVAWSWRKRPDLVRAGVTAYVRPAVWLAVVVLASGLGTGLAIFDSVSEVVDTAYGRVLLVKGALVLIALVMAATGRRTVRRPPSPLGNARLQTVLRSESAVLAIVLTVSAVLVNVAPPRPPEAAAAALGAVAPSGPAIRLGGLAGELTVGLTASADQLALEVIAPELGQKKPHYSVMVSSVDPAGGSTTLFPRQCGNACFVLAHRWTPGVHRVAVTAHAPPFTGGTAHFVVPWPPSSDASPLLRQVVEALRAQARLLVNEQVTSGPRARGAPHATELSGTAFLDTEPYAGGAAADVRVLSVRGGETELAFAVPGAELWFRLSVPPDLLPVREVIVSANHLITRTFNYSTR